MTYVDVLRLIEASPTIRLRDIAEALSVPSSTAASRCKYLLETGLVRQPGWGTYEITDAGRAELEAATREGPRRGAPPRHAAPRASGALSPRQGVRQTMAAAALYPEPQEPLPATRGDCADGPRPCPMVRCRYHLALEATEAGTIRLRYPEREVWEMEHTCLLDLADQGPREIREIAQILGVTEQSVGQILASAMHNAAPALAAIDDDDGHRRLPLLQAAE